MNKFNLIETFFHHPNEYIKFLVELKQKIIANDEATCFAELTKENGCYLYKITWLTVGKFIGDYVKPFRASLENIKTFNEGCKILAERLTIFIETNNSALIPSKPPAFKELTEIK
jgi:hypothetical protein